jgi:site-specific DNA-methyltransferase (adenine-specific)
MGRIVLADNLAVLAETPSDSVDLIYVDPPFNTGRRQTLDRVRTVRDDENGDRTGFQGRRYRTVRLGSSSFLDVHDDYLAFLEPRLREFQRVLSASGSLYLHVDYREVHHLQGAARRDLWSGRAFNEIIWGLRLRRAIETPLAPNTTTSLVYVKHPRAYYFDSEAAERIPYMAPSLVGAEKAARGKTPTDTGWHTIVPPGGKERTGYPTQKPLGILRRIVRTSCPPGGLVADYFAGSGTTGIAAHESNRRFILVDQSEAAWQVMTQRFAHLDGIELVR